MPSCLRKVDTMPNFIKNSSIKMQRWLERQWYSDQLGVWYFLLMPLDLLMRLLVLLRQFFYKAGILSSWRSPIPVIVVGNITVGGTGKTPLVIWLVEMLKAKGYKPGIVSRGYGGSARGVASVSVDADPMLVGDEPLLMAKQSACPVWIGKDRPAAAKALIEAHPECDVIISDDGLQHYALQRDMEIVVVDGVRLYGNKAMLPIGPMREPLRRLMHVDAVVVNGGKRDGAAGEYSMRLCGEHFYALHSPEKQVKADHFKNKRVHAVAGIGNPARFFNQLRELGLNVIEHAFSDHHQFQPADLQIQGAEAILMTEKDAVKCLQFSQDNIWVLPVQVKEVSGLEDKVIQKIESFYGRKTA